MQAGDLLHFMLDPAAFFARRPQARSLFDPQERGLALCKGIFVKDFFDLGSGEFVHF